MGGVVLDNQTDMAAWEHESLLKGIGNAQKSFFHQVSEREWEASSWLKIWKFWRVEQWFS